jgi:exopolyphosphatase/guanosine-5'-triphosphate,3'-diphosphate pyrophosphatase
VRRACIDIGSNTTRLLVAECDRDQLLEIHQLRAFTRVGHGLGPGGLIPAAKIDEVASVGAKGSCHLSPSHQPALPQDRQQRIEVRPHRLREHRAVIGELQHVDVEVTRVAGRLL